MPGGLQCGFGIDPGKSKARYRRGLAYEGLGDYSSAYNDLRAVSFSNASPIVNEAEDRVLLRSYVLSGATSRERKGSRGVFPRLHADRVQAIEVAFQKFFATVGSVTAMVPVFHTPPSDPPPPLPLRFRNVPVVVASVAAAHRSLSGKSPQEIASAEEVYLLHPDLPSLCILRALGLHSRFPNVVIARFHCLRLAYEHYQQGKDEGPSLEAVKPWVQAWREEAREGQWEEWVLSVPAVASSKWARYLRERGGTWGRGMSVMPGDGEKEEAIRLFPWEAEVGAGGEENKKLDTPTELWLLAGGAERWKGYKEGSIRR